MSPAMPNAVEIRLIVRELLRHRIDVVQVVAPCGGHLDAAADEHRRAPAGRR